MGGHKAGGYASSCAVETILEGIRESESSDPEEILTEAIQKANEVIERRAGEDERLSGMGTTVVAACWDGKELHTANVGDSRLYVVNGGIEQITEDHSLVQEMVRVGGINKEEARSHPNKNIITRAVGLERYLRVDCFRRTLEPGNIVLLCSDGLTDMLEDAEIYRIDPPWFHQEVLHIRYPDQYLSWACPDYPGFLPYFPRCLLHFPRPPACRLLPHHCR